MIRGISSLVLLLAVASAGSPVVELAGLTQQEPERAPELEEPVTVVLVRHAEKGGDDPRDPGLSEDGEARAERLAQLLADANVTHLFASEYRRTADTLAPLAQALGLEVQRVPARDRARQVAALRALPPGSVAVVAGHSNTTPALASELGTSPAGLVETRYGPSFPEDAYGRLLFVVLGDAEGPEAKRASKLVQLAY